MCPQLKKIWNHKYFPKYKYFNRFFQSDEEKAQAEKKFRDIRDAHEVLTDDEMRRQFDQGSDPLDAEEQAEQNQNPFGRGGFNPFQGGFGGGFGGGGGKKRRGGGGHTFHFNF